MADPRAPQGRTPDSGVTLIEVLIVLVLVAISASVVTLALPNTSPGRSFVQEADLMVARLNLAAERSLIEGRTFRMEWSAGGYGFSERTAGAWQPSTSETLPAEHLLGGGAAMAVPNGTGEIVIAPDLLPPAGGATSLILTSGTAQSRIRFDGLRAEAGS